MKTADKKPQMVPSPRNCFEDVLDEFGQKYAPEIVDKVNRSLEHLCDRDQFDPIANSFVRRLFRNWKPAGAGKVASDVAANFLTNVAPKYLAAAERGDHETQKAIAEQWKDSLGPDSLLSQHPAWSKPIEFKPIDRGLEEGKSHIKTFFGEAILGLSSVAAASSPNTIWLTPILWGAAVIVGTYGKAKTIVGVIRGGVDLSKSVIGACRKIFEKATYATVVEDNPELFPLLPEFAAMARNPGADQKSIATRSYNRLMKVIEALPITTRMTLNSVNADGLVLGATAVLDHIGPAETLLDIEKKIRSHPDESSSVFMKALAQQQSGHLNQIRQSAVNAIQKAPEVMADMLFGGPERQEASDMVGLAFDKSRIAIMRLKAKNKLATEQSITATPGLRM